MHDLWKEQDKASSLGSDGLMKESWERAEKSAKTVLRQWQCWEIAERELRDCWETAVKTACKSEQELWRLILRIQKYHTHTQTQTDRHTNRVTSWAPGRSQNLARSSSVFATLHVYPRTPDSIICQMGIDPYDLFFEHQDWSLRAQK